MNLNFHLLTKISIFSLLSHKEVQKYKGFGCWRREPISICVLYHNGLWMWNHNFCFYILFWLVIKNEVTPVHLRVCINKRVKEYHTHLKTWTTFSLWPPKWIANQKRKDIIFDHLKGWENNRVKVDFMPVWKDVTTTGKKQFILVYNVNRDMADMRYKVSKYKCTDKQQWQLGLQNGQTESIGWHLGTNDYLISELIKRKNTSKYSQNHSLSGHLIL